MIQAATILAIFVSVFATSCSKAEATASGDRALREASELRAHPTGKDRAERPVRVSVGDDGFKPSRVELKTGQRATLRFTRRSNNTCATKVVFPDLNIEKELPLNTAVDVEVPTAQARQLTFQCGMGMYKSAVVVN